MTDVDTQLGLLRKHIETVDVPDVPRLELHRPRKSRFAIVAPWALGALVVSAPAFAAVYSYYAIGNAESARLAAALSKARGVAVKPDRVVEESAPRMSEAFAKHGFRVVRSATFGSGAMQVEFYGAGGHTSVFFERDEKSRENTLVEIPSGGKIEYYASRRRPILGSDEVLIDSARKLPDAAVNEIVDIATAFDRSERGRMR